MPGGVVRPKVDLMQSQKILITGGAGYIGLHLVLALQEAGYQPVVVDNLQRGRFDLIPHGTPFYNLDFTDVAALTALCQEIRPQAVFHVGARLSVEESTKIPLAYYHTNVTGTLSVCEAVKASGVPHLIFSSTCCVYGNPDTSDKPVDEDTALHPCSPYGHSKAMGEQIIRDAARDADFSYVVLRYFNVTGADAKLRAGPYTDQPVLLVDRVCQAICGDLPYLTVNGTDYPTADGTAVRDYIHVSDIANAHIAALQHLQKGKESGTYNCGYGKGISVKQILDTAKRVSGVDFPVEYGPRRSGDMAAIEADTTRILSIGWEPKHDDLNEMIGSALRWYKQQTGR